MNTIPFDTFASCDIRIGRFVSVEPVEGSDKLYKEIIDFGPELGQRQILSGIRKFYEPEELVGRLAVFIVNLEPRKMMGLESQGMLLAIDGPERPLLLSVDGSAEVGSKVR